MRREGAATAILTIGKRGNASAIRLPKSFCETLGIGVGDDMRMFVENDRRAIIEPVRDEHSLKGRMRSWNGERYHGDELDWSDVAGKELW